MYAGDTFTFCALSELSDAAIILLENTQANKSADLCLNIAITCILRNVQLCVGVEFPAACCSTGQQKSKFK